MPVPGLLCRVACLGSSSTAGKGQAFNWIESLQNRGMWQCSSSFPSGESLIELFGQSYIFGKLGITSKSDMCWDFNLTHYPFGNLIALPPRFWFRQVLLTPVRVSAFGDFAASSTV